MRSNNMRQMLAFNIVAREAMLLALPCLFVRALYADRQGHRAAAVAVSLTPAGG